MTEEKSFTGSAMWIAGLRWVKTLVTGVSVVVALTGMSYKYGSFSAQGATQWTTLSYENFSGPAGRQVDNHYWKYETGSNPYNDEKEVYTNSTKNVYLDGNGDLDITALDQGGTWTSGRIVSTRMFGAAAGGELQVTASIKQPSPANGNGYWPAFWLLGSGAWPQNGEIDILEDVNAASEHSAALHCGNLTARNSDGTYGPCHEHNGIGSGLLSCAGCQSGYHTYSMIIDRRNQANEQISWYLDNHEFFNVTEQQLGAQVWTQAFDHSFPIIFDLAIGGSYPDAVCGCTTPTTQTSSGGTLSIRSVAVYQN